MNMSKNELQSMRAKTAVKRGATRAFNRIEYRGMSTSDMLKKAALDYSDNGRCWWIELKIKERMSVHEARRKVNAEQKSKIKKARKKEAELVA